MTRVKTGPAPLHEAVLPYANSPVIAIDTETSGLDWWLRDFFNGGWVLYSPEAGSTYIPVRHESVFDTDLNQNPAHIAESIQILADDKSRTWLMHNRAYDENVAATEGVTFAGPIIDTLSLWWSISPWWKSFALKRLGTMVDKNAGSEEYKLAEFLRQNKLKRYTQVPVDVMEPYAKQDGVLTYKLWELGEKTLVDSQRHVNEKEQRWMQTVSHMMARGVPFDRELAQEIIDSHHAEAHRLAISLGKQAGVTGFNPTSWQQVKAAASKMGVELPATAEDDLNQSNLPKKWREGVVRYRKLIHTIGSYLEPMYRCSRDSVTGRVHSSFRTTTKTGRLASGDRGLRYPINLQGLPRAGEFADIHRVRECVRFPDEDRRIGFADFAQVDVRVGAHYSKDKDIAEVLKDPDGDIHTMMLNELTEMGIKLDRYEAKQHVFANQYGVGPKTFSERVSGLDSNGNYRKVSEREALRQLTAVRARFPGASHAIRAVEAVMKQRGIFLADGRWIGCPDEEDPHKAFAWLVQGSGAQLIKGAMNKVDEWFDTNGLDCSLFLQIHDEIVWEAPSEVIEATASFVAQTMASIWPKCEIPLYVQSAQASPSWQDRKPVGLRFPRDRETWEAWRLDPQGQLVLS